MRTWVASAAVVLVAAGCGGDDPTGVSGDELTADELNAIFTTIGLAFASLQPVPGAAATHGDVVNLAGTAQCPAGGTIEGTGSLDAYVNQSTGESDFTYVATFIPTGCMVSTSSATVTVDGNPSLVVDFTSDFSSSGSTTSGSWTGGLSYSTSGGSSGQCSLDVSFTSSYTTGGSTPTSSVTGTACGISATQFDALALSSG